MIPQKEGAMQAPIHKNKKNGKLYVHRSLVISQHYRCTHFLIRFQNDFVLFEEKSERIIQYSLCAEDDSLRTDVPGVSHSGESTWQAAKTGLFDSLIYIFAVSSSVSVNSRRNSSGE